VGVTNAARRGRLALLAAFLAVVALAASPGRGLAAAHAQAQAKGIDVSTWNGVIDWIRVASNGYKFVFGKATEGITLTDPTYSVNRAGTEGFGLRFGAYHFARPAGTSDALRTANAIAQADHFVDVAEPKPGELPPVLDLEKNGGLNPTNLQYWTRAWMDEVYARTGLHASVYVSPDFWTKSVANTTDFASAGNRLWIAHWTTKAAPLVPAQNWGGLGWTWWQWTDCSAVPGFAHCSDGDRMNGPDPGAVAIGAYPTGLPAVSTPPSIVGTTGVGKALAAVPGVWTGGKPVQFAYEWQSCDAAGENCATIPGATAAKYVPTAAQVGHSLVLSVTATSAAGGTTVSTEPTAAIAGSGAKPGTRPEVIESPLVAGTPQVGQQLTAQVGTWSGSPTTFAYQWQRCDGGGANCTAIVDAVSDTYTLTPDDIGSTLSLVVTATGTGGATSSTTVATAPVAAAPLPDLATGSQTAEPGVAGNVQTDDGRAIVTWQPGAVPDGLQLVVAPFTGTLSIPGTEVAIGVAGLGAGGFTWPVDIAYATPQPAGTVLGYSTDAKLYAAVPALPSPELPSGETLGYYVQDGIAHVLTRIPVRLALFQAGAWGDPSLSAVTGPTLVQHSTVHLLARPDKTLLVLTRLSSPSQADLFAQVIAKGGKRIPILPKGSIFGKALKPGVAPKTARAQLLRPGGIVVRLRLNTRLLKHGSTYTLRVIALDPFGRIDTELYPFTYR
jgi:GH25 family lysozyme M1 (1,4-beta-N-acetylmuramidase)